MRVKRVSAYYPVDFVQSRYIVKGPKTLSTLRNSGVSILQGLYYITVNGNAVLTEQNVR